MCQPNSKPPSSPTSKTKDHRTKLLQTCRPNLKAITNSLLDPLHFAYSTNRSEDDGLYFVLQPLDSSGTYARTPLVGFSSVLNTITLVLLQDKLAQLRVPDSTCRCIIDFLSDRRQHGELGKRVSASHTISTGSPKAESFPLCSSHCTPTAAPSVIGQVERTPSHPPPSPCVTLQSTLWSPSTS